MSEYFNRFATFCRREEKHMGMLLASVPDLSTDAEINQTWQDILDARKVAANEYHVQLLNQRVNGDQSVMLDENKYFRRWTEVFEMMVEKRRKAVPLPLQTTIVSATLAGVFEEKA